MALYPSENSIKNYNSQRTDGFGLVSLPHSKPNATIRVVNAVIQEARSSCIDASDSTKSRLTSTSMAMSHAILIQGDLVPESLKQRPQLLRLSHESQGFFETAILYLELGFVHILPRGLDHILFVLALIFLSLRIKLLIIQISIFCRTYLNVSTRNPETISAPSSFEPLIALSIVFVAIENICKDRKLASVNHLWFGYYMD